jgi:hypothetical protein
MPIILRSSIALLAIEYRMTGTFFRASSSEASGRVVLGDKLGLLVSHFLLLFHNIPHESMLSRWIVAHHAARVSVRCVLRLQKV